MRNTAKELAKDMNISEELAQKLLNTDVLNQAGLKWYAVFDGDKEVASYPYEVFAEVFVEQNKRLKPELELKIVEKIFQFC